MKEKEKWKKERAKRERVKTLFLFLVLCGIKVLLMRAHNQASLPPDLI